MLDDSDLELLGELETLHEEFGRVPTKALVAGQGAHPPAEFIDRFGSWEEALGLAGFDPDKRDDERYHTLHHLDDPVLSFVVDSLDSNDEKKFFRGQLLAEMNRLAVELGKTPSEPDMARFGRYSHTSYKTYFGSWNAAVILLGLVPNDDLVRISEDELLSELKRLAEEMGTRPSTVDMRERGKYSYPTYIYRFGSWQDACEEAGV